MKTLIVEDDFVSRKILLRQLSKLGECDLAVNGTEAIEAFMQASKESEPYDLICLDIMLPGMDGIAVLKKIRVLEGQEGLNTPKRVKILMTTSLSDKEIVIKAIQAQCDGYLVKPVAQQKLEDKLKELKLLA
jgi:two-component system chemotaxis response regulator CheY